MKLRSIILAAALLVSGLSVTFSARLAAAQAPPPTAGLIADRPAFEAGTEGSFKGLGFGPGETVTFRISHVRGGPVVGTMHTAAEVVADAGGAFMATWLVCSTDCAGEMLQIQATGRTSGKVGRAIFMDLPTSPRSGSRVWTDRADYPPGTRANITGGGFKAGEAVTLQVHHADGTPNNGADHAPWVVIASPDGGLTTTWHVCEDDCRGSTLRLTAVGQTSGWTAQAIFTDGVGTFTFERIKSFGTPGTGTYPRAGLLRGSDGALYGTTNNGGKFNYGTMFKMNPDGSGFIVLKNFNAFGGGGNPAGRLMQGTDGALYGTTQLGGSSFAGTVFKLNTDGSGFTVLLSFDYSTTGNSPQAGVIQGTDGALYGTTPYGGSSGSGTVFKLNTDGTGFLVLQNLDYSTTGTGSYGELVQGTDGALYGTTLDGGSGFAGTVFKLNTDGSGFTVLQSFDYSTIGGSPPAGVIQGTDGALYGTTRYGGSGFAGTVFKLNTDGSGFTVLQSFDYSTTGGSPQAGVIQGTDGALYGTTLYGGSGFVGTVFKLNTDGSDFTVLVSFDYSTEGGYGFGGVVQGSDGALYGTTLNGGGSGYGTVFKLNTNGTGFAVLLNFNITSDLEGAYPSGIVQGADGALYGTVSGGGSGGYGSVFKMNTDGTGFVTLHTFNYFDGAYPQSGVMQGADGALYGTTIYGGNSSGYGTAFKVNTNGTGFVVLHSFGSSGGAHPLARLVQGADGALYGTTLYLWSSLFGLVDGATVFKLNTDGTNFTVLKSFDYDAEGGYALGGVVQGSDGALYGAVWNRSGGRGNAYRLNPDGSGFALLKEMSAGIVSLQGADGALYGTGAVGPSYYPGVFRMNTDGTGSVALHAFDYSDGLLTGVLQGADGALYGTAVGDGFSAYGFAYGLNRDGSGFTVLHNFDNGPNGGYPNGLAKATDGSLYGTARDGGDAGLGVVYRLAPACDAIAPVVNLTGPASGSVYAVGTAVNFAATFTDASGSPHEATWTFDTVTQPGTVVEGAPGTVTAEYSFTAAGVYQVQLAVTDPCGNTGSANQVGGVDALVVIYDPDAGFVTGGGWINSPAGAYPADPALTGRANFGFVSKYRRGASIPTGETEFRYSVGDLNFHSTSYQWLVVGGAKAQYKGSGTINGVGNYGFILTAVDGQVSGGGGQDKFRIKITDANGVVYDNMLNAADSAVPTTVLGGGSIVIHTEGPGSAAAGLPGEEPGEVTATVPTEYDLSPNYPNPFDRSTQIGFALPERSRVSLVVYDLAGRTVRTLAGGEWEPGQHSTTLATTRGGDPLGAGVYFVRMNAQSLASGRSFTTFRRIVVFK